MGLKHKKKRLLDIYDIGKGGSVNLKNLTPEEQMEIRKELGLYYSDIEEKKGNRLYIDMNNLVGIPIGSGGDSPVYNSINPDLKGEPTREGNNDVQIGMFSYIPFTLPETMVHYSNENNGGGDDYLAMSVNSPKTREVEEDVYVDYVYPYFDWVVGENTYGAYDLRTDSKDKPLEPSNYSSHHYFFYVHTEGDYDFAGGSSPARGETSETAVHLKPGFYLSLYMNGQPLVCGMIKLSDNDSYYDQDNNDTGKTSHEYFGDIFPTQSNVVTLEYIQSILPPQLDESIIYDSKLYFVDNELYLYQLYAGKLQGITLPQDEDNDNQDDAKAPSPTPFGNVPFTGSFYYKEDPYYYLSDLSVIRKDEHINGLYGLDYNWNLYYIPEDIDLSQNNEPDIQESLSSTRSKKSDLSKFIKNVKSLGDTVIPAGLYVDIAEIYSNNYNYDEFAISIQTTSKIVNTTEEVVKGQIDCKYIPDDCKGGGSSSKILYVNYNEDDISVYSDPEFENELTGEEVDAYFVGEDDAVYQDVKLCVKNLSDPKGRNVGIEYREFFSPVGLEYWDHKIYKTRFQSRIMPFSDSNGSGFCYAEFYHCEDNNHICFGGFFPIIYTQNQD